MPAYWFQDPEFYQFLKDHDKELLEFEDEDEDEDAEVPFSRPPFY